MLFWCYIDFLRFIFSYFSLFIDLPSEVTLSAILFSIKSSVASTVFCTTVLETLFAASAPVFVAVSINQYLLVQLNIAFVFCIYPVANVIFTLFSISRGLLFSSVNQTSIILFNVNIVWLYSMLSMNVVKC